MKGTLNLIPQPQFKLEAATAALNISKRKHSATEREAQGSENETRTSAERISTLAKHCRSRNNKLEATQPNGKVIPQRSYLRTKISAVGGRPRSETLGSLGMWPREGKRH